MNSAWSRAPIREQKTSSVRITFIFLGLACTIGWLYTIFISDLFLVRHIEATGLVSMDELDVKREVLAILDERGGWRPWSARHIWFIDVDFVEEELKRRLFASQVAVDKSYTGILRLKIEERSNKLILHSRQQYLWVDLQGMITRELTLGEQKNVQALILGQRQMLPTETPIIHYSVDELLAPGYSVAPSETVKGWITTATELAKGGFLFREIDIETPSSTTARVINDSGYSVLVDMSVPLENQIRAYKAFVESKPKDIKVTEYLDVRVPGRIYVK